MPETKVTSRQINALPVALIDGANIAVDASLGHSFRVTLGGNRTLDNPTNLYDGQELLFEFIQDATGGRTLAFGSKYAGNLFINYEANSRTFLRFAYHLATDTLYLIDSSLNNAFIRQSADRTLANQTTAQQIFGTTNGAITLAPGAYKFRGLVTVTAMSATSGNATFSLGGSAVLAGIIFAGLGRDQTPDQSAGTWTGTYSLDATLVAAPGFTAGTATALCAILEGTFEVTTGGTVIPNILLQTAIGTAIVVRGSYFEVTRLGSASVSFAGQWN